MESISENVNYDFLTSTEENFWSLLYLTGYLTRAVTKRQEDTPQRRSFYSIMER